MFDCSCVYDTESFFFLSFFLFIQSTRRFALSALEIAYGRDLVYLNRSIVSPSIFVHLLCIVGDNFAIPRRVV